MIKTILFVHGTGVRKASYDVAAAKVQSALKQIGFRGRLEPCLWGETRGAKLAKDGKSIPDYEGVVPPTPDEEAWRALWALLAEDNFFELRQLIGDAKPGGFVPPAAQEEIDEFPDRLRSLAQRPAVIVALADAATAAQLTAALEAVASSDALAQALQSVPTVDASLRQGGARAAVAWLQAQRGDDSPLPVAQRDALVVALVDGLGGVEMGSVKDWVKSRLKGLGMRLLTSAAQRRRDVLYGAAYPAAGDILLYQARGKPIRDFIAGRLDACGDDVAVIAHSLGGIACVDLLAMQPRPQVRLLVTVGSQAPLLYELGALQSLEPHAALPPHFPKTWLNFYNRDDFLSYLAAPVFGAPARDIEVKSEHPFPQSHSAYWEIQMLWTRLQPYL